MNHKDRLRIKPKKISTFKGETLKKSTIEYPKSEAELKTLPGHTNNPLSSFNYFPSKVDFVNKEMKKVFPLGVFKDK